MASNRTAAVFVTLGLTIFMVFLVAGNSCSSSSTSVLDNPALAVKANLALGASLAPYVDTVTADSAGAVIVTLNQTSAAIAGDAGENGAAKVGGGVGSIVLNAVPEATSVAVFDANNKLLRVSKR